MDEPERIDFRLTPFQRETLHQYFAGISQWVARYHAVAKDEEAVTAGLCAMFNEQGNDLFALPLTLQQLKSQLADERSGPTIDLDISMVTHSRSFEGSTSAADFGLIFTLSSGLESEVRALLIQAKKLYPTSKGYSIKGRYKATNHLQHARLKELAPNCASQYLLYNPGLKSFLSSDHGTIKFAEQCIALRNYSHCHEGCTESFLETCTGLRVMGASMFPVKEKGQPTLSDVYQAASDNQDCRLHTFADFMVDRIIGREFGSSERRLIAIANGDSDTDCPKHTMKLSITLP